jgi:predicted ATP-dependent endonuclease of OLD family
MKFKKITIDGFRCLCNLSLELEDDVTLIIGENDSGKSSIIDSINLFTGRYSLDEDDFNIKKDTIKIDLVTDEMEYIKEYKKAEPAQGILKINPTEEYRASCIQFIDSLSDTLTSEQETKIRELSKSMGITVRSNSNPSTLIKQLMEKLGEKEVEVDEKNFPELSLIQLDGKHFEDVDGFFKEVFLKEKEGKIWDTKTADDRTIRDVVQSELDNYSNDISRELETKGIKTKMQQYLQFSDLKIKTSFEPQALKIEAKATFLERGEEIALEKKGDGTKKRISLALLEYKAETATKACSRIYILDEPDAHLHVKAQLDLLKTLKTISEKSSQVILSTHSPFLINAVSPKQTRLLVKTEDNLTELRQLRNDPGVSNKLLKQLGIENVYLFFAKKIILVEGEAETAFLPRIYEKIYATPMNSDLIKAINVQGINNIPGFAKALLELMDKNTIYILRDNDASAITSDLISRLGLAATQQTTVGVKEFEDAFDDETLYNCWKQYLIECGHNTGGADWTKENIQEIRGECAKDPTKKFSAELISLNKGTGKKLTKTLLGEKLGDYCNIENIPQEIANLLAKLHTI